MSYSTPSQVRAALSAGITFDGSTAASLTDADLQDKITEADTLIDGYLSARYALPITVTVPPLLMITSRDLAAYYATLTWLGNVPLDDKHPVKLRADKAEAVLDKIQSGKIMLPLPGAGSDQRTDDPWVENRYDGDMFCAGDFDLYGLPSGWLQ